MCVSQASRRSPSVSCNHRHNLLTVRLHWLTTAGPMAHPIRPESYIKMDNFYTLTVYEKGESESVL